VTKLYIRIRESLPVQTMTEYALILPTIAVVVYGVYAAMGNNIGAPASGIDSPSPTLNCTRVNRASSAKTTKDGRERAR
jgi:hypothetical protein